jgi:hypothetical protein
MRYDPPGDYRCDVRKSEGDFRRQYTTKRRNNDRAGSRQEHAEPNCDWSVDLKHLTSNSVYTDAGVRITIDIVDVGLVAQIALLSVP